MFEENETERNYENQTMYVRQAQHVHAPPIQPLTLALNPHIALRVLSQDSVNLTFTAEHKSVRFQAGTHVKVSTTGIRSSETFVFHSLRTAEWQTFLQRSVLAVEFCCV